MFYLAFASLVEDILETSIDDWYIIILLYFDWIRKYGNFYFVIPFIIRMT